MNLVNKNIKIFFILLLSILVLIFVGKQILGYSPIGYLYNGYFNSTHNFEIVNKNYKIKLPFFSWRIAEKKKENIVLNGMYTKKGFLTASIDNKFLAKSIDEVKTMCEGEQTVKSFNINNNKAFDIYCKSNHIDQLKPYRILFIPKKLFIFMYNYQIKYNNNYEKLIANIQIIE